MPNFRDNKENDNSQCLYDSEKTVVMRWEAGQPIFNPAFSAFITHYHCRPIACQRGRPETNAQVEGLVNKIKTLKRQAYGYRDMEYFKLRLYHLHQSMYSFAG